MTLTSTPVNSAFYPAIEIWRRSFSFLCFGGRAGDSRDQTSARFRFSSVSPLAGGLFGGFRDWRIAQFRGLEETCGLLATAGDNPNPETPSFLSIFFDPWIPLFAVFPGPGLSGPGSLFWLFFILILVISRYTAGKHTRRMGILLIQTV